MATPDRKVRKLMQEYQKTGSIVKAALNADLDRKTASKYIKKGSLPSQMRTDHTWRTRADPFEQHWPECVAILENAKEIEAKVLFECLCERYPGVYQEGQLRTLQRRLRAWRALNGADKEAFFPQVHEPGKRMSTDCTHMDELGITINGEPFPHLLCHCVLPFSNWQWGTICHSESLLALRTGIQAALIRLGHIPREHWTDHSSAATHQPGETEGPGRPFNQDYLSMMEHLGMKPRTIQVGAPNENGDVESLNGVLKRRMKQYLLLRGSTEFESIEQYRVFLEQTLEKANRGRTERIAEELKHMGLLNVSRLAEYDEYRCKVRSSSTITVKRRIYSLPTRLIGHSVTVRRYETRVEVFYNGVHQLTAPWITRDKGHHIDYRHLIDSLVRKPGAFRQYRFRDELFPSDLFKWAWECLSEAVCERTAEREYLQLLKQAADTMQCTVDAALSRIRAGGGIPRLDRVLELTRPAPPEPPALMALTVNLLDYDDLLDSGRVSA